MEEDTDKIAPKEKDPERIDDESEIAKGMRKTQFI